jgi:hypothetical protein
MLPWQQRRNVVSDGLHSFLDRRKAQMRTDGIYKSVTCKRVTCSVLAAEAISFAEGFDQGYTLKTDLQELFGRNIPLTILTDSKMIFRCHHKSIVYTRERILIDLASVREGYRRFDIDDIGLISSEENLSDSLTKETNMNKLREAVSIGRLQTVGKQFFIHPPESASS